MCKAHGICTARSFVVLCTTCHTRELLNRSVHTISFVVAACQRAQPSLPLPCMSNNVSLARRRRRVHNDFLVNNIPTQTVINQFVCVLAHSRYSRSLCSTFSPSFSLFFTSASLFSWMAYLSSSISIPTQKES